MAIGNKSLYASAGPDARIANIGFVVPFPGTALPPGHEFVEGLAFDISPVQPFTEA